MNAPVATSPGDDQFLVVAATFEEFEAHLREFGYDRTRARLVRFTDQIHGYRNMDVHYVGQYYKLPDLPEIVDYCREYNMTVPEGK